MAIDTMERPPVTRPPDATYLGPPKKEKQPSQETIANSLNLLDDDYNNKGILLLKPLKSASAKDKYGNEIDWDPILFSDFEYLSRTGDLETNTNRTAILQDILDRMTTGTDIKTRVVIINKGEQPNASAYPDGTIFVTQSLLNKASNLDEIAAVLGHETSHLIFKTSLSVASSDLENRFGLNWAHEDACDHNGRELTAKLGFATMSLSNIFEHIGLDKRGISHQSGLARSSQNVAAHYAIDYPTSNKEPAPIPDILKKPSRKSNLEIINQVTPQLLSAGPLVSFLPKLHERDIVSMHRIAQDTLRESNLSDKLDQKVFSEIADICEDIFVQRLAESGFSKDQITTFITTLSEDTRIAREFMRSPEDLLAISKLLLENPQEVRLKLSDMYKTLSLQEKDIHIENFFRNIGKDLFDPNFTPNQDGIPADQETIIKIISLFQNAKINRSSDIDINTGRNFLADYLVNAYVVKLLPNKNKTIDQKTLKDFLVKIARAGVNLNQDFLYALSGSYGESYTNSPYHNEAALQKLNILEQLIIETHKEISEKSTAPAIENFIISLENESLLHLPIKNGFDEFALKINAFEDEWTSLDDKKRLIYLNRICNIIDSLDAAPSQSLPEEKQVISQGIIKFYKKMALGIIVFQNDSAGFYTYVNSIMQKFNIDPHQLSIAQFHDLIAPIIHVPSSSRHYFFPLLNFSFNKREPFVVKDYESFLSLPILKEFGQRILEEPDKNLSLNEFEQQTLYISHVELFEDSLLALLTNRTLRKSWLKIIERGISEQNYDLVYGIIDRIYPNSPQKQNILRNINKTYLNLPHIPIENKIDYLMKYYDKIGPEGMSILAEQINDLPTYGNFRERLKNKLDEYLSSGSARFTGLAAADLLTSKLQNFDFLFETALGDNEAQKKSSTKFAISWLQSIYIGVARMNWDRRKILIDSKKRDVFRTVNDIFLSLKNFNALQRLALVHKALTEVNGAFSSNENRKKLSKFTIKILQPKSKFVAEILKTSLINSDPKMLSFPISRMLGQFLFRSLDTKKIDIGRIQQRRPIYTQDEKGKIISSSDLGRIFSSTTRDIVFFGPQYTNQPNSFAAKLAQESDDDYHQSLLMLEHLFSAAEDMSEEKKLQESEVSPSTEAIIQGVEMCGALGVRSLQLATQLHRFSSALENRLSQTLDSNPGLNDLLFWENLWRKTQEKPELKQFIDNLSIGRKLGGGSLYTVYAATQSLPDGTKKAIVLKMLNPNAATLMRETASLAKDVLERVGETHDSQNKRYADMGMVLVDLAQNWCLKDINDATFEQDDMAFREIIEDYNKTQNETHLYAPELVLTTPDLKSEEQAMGITLNQMLKREDVDFETKQKAIEAISKFFFYQLKNGRNLIHSDPHVGNFIIDASNSQLKVGVIDRNMYLKLSDKQIKAFEPLIRQDSDRRFFNSFVDIVLDANKIRGDAERRNIIRNLEMTIMKRHGWQMLRDKADQFTLLRTISSELAKKNIIVPLEIQLMIKNITSIKSLASRYGIDIKDLYDSQ